MIKQWLTDISDDILFGNLDNKNHCLIYSLPSKPCKYIHWYHMNIDQIVKWEKGTYHTGRDTKDKNNYKFANLEAVRNLVQNRNRQHEVRDIFIRNSVRTMLQI